MGIKRMGHTVSPGLYKLGKPGPESPVFVTANYTLSFDALRSSLKGYDAYILVLNTSGINVWCAAGKGTFGTDELVRQIEQTRLDNFITHRHLILPQLGAPGVSAHQVREKTGFHVRYGPVRAADIPEYLHQGTVAAGSRKVTFPLKDRLVLIPVELRPVALPMLVLGMILFFTVGPLPAWAMAGAVLAGIVLFPILLPWLPTKNFSSKGFILGGIMATVFGLLHMLGSDSRSPVYIIVSTLAYLIALPPVTAFFSLNFTGATTFTSRSGVRKEIRVYFPVMVWMAGTGVVLFLAAIILSLSTT
jgi:hypothetical protein